jgi:hypothetical protein
MKAYKHLVKHALAKGLTVSVFDGEEWAVKRSVAHNEIIDAIESVEEAEIRIRDSNGAPVGDKSSKIVGWALIIPFGMEDDETVADYTDNDFMNEWDQAYSKSV